MTPTKSQPMPSRDPRVKAAQFHHLAEILKDLERGLHYGLNASDRIPDDWHLIASQPPVPFKVPVTIRIDEDVAQFFRTMGRGHLTRMNAVLRAFMLARLAGVVEGAEDVSY